MQEAIYELLRSGNTLDQIVKMLPQVLAQYPHHHSLHFYQANLGGVSVLPLITALRFNTNLHHLHLAHTGLDAPAVQTLADILLVDSCLQSLDLSSNYLNPTALLPLLQSLSVNKSLRHLNIGANEFDYAAVLTLVMALRLNQCLRSLDVHSTRLRGPALRVLIEALPDISNLRSLNLSSNFFKLDDVEALAVILLGNSNLHRLYLSDACLDDACLGSLLEMLRINRALHTVDLSDNIQISPYHMLNILEVIEDNSSLFRLNLSGTFNAYPVQERLYHLLYVQRNAIPLSLASIIFSYISRLPEIEQTFGILPKELLVLIFKDCIANRELPEVPDYTWPSAQNRTNDEYCQGIWKTVETICERRGITSTKTTTHTPASNRATALTRLRSRSQSNINSRARRNVKMADNPGVDIQLADQVKRELIIESVNRAVSAFKIRVNKYRVRMYSEFIALSPQLEKGEKLLADCKQKNILDEVQRVIVEYLRNDKTTLNKNSFKLMLLHELVQVFNPANKALEKEPAEFLKSVRMILNLPAAPKSSMQNDNNSSSNSFTTAPPCEQSDRPPPFSKK